MIFAMVRASSWLVPREERAEWLAEWRAEYCHVAAAGGTARAIAFCRGAIPDALWMRRQYPPSERRGAKLMDTPARCLLVLAVLTAAAATLGPRAAWLPQGLIAISAYGGASPRIASVTFEEYRILAARRTFSELAYYRVEWTGGLAVAVGSANFLEVLGVAAPRIDGRAMVVRNAALRTHPEVLRRRLPVAGVVPRRAWPLSDRIDAFVLDPALDLPRDARGFVFGKMAEGPPAALWRIFVGGPHSVPRSLECVALARMTPASARLMMAGIAFLAVVALMAMLPGQYPLSWRLSGWLFWAAKTALAAATITLAFSPDLLLIGYFAAFCWAALDQRRRCPVCLRQLTRPVSIGSASHVLLDWYGTELMCIEGHGLLYEPELPASAYSARRWQRLDPSWTSLF